MKALILYWSVGGNTEKVARAIQEGWKSEMGEVSLQKIEKGLEVDFFEYDLLGVGFPSYHWHPPAVVNDFLKKKFSEYRSQGRVKTGAPPIPGKNALVFCTYSGPHTGIHEATPAGQYVGQFFEHLGFAVQGEWYIVGEFHGSEEKSTRGRLGDIRGRPNAEDLERVRQDSAILAKRLARGFNSKVPGGARDGT